MCGGGEGTGVLLTGPRGVQEGHGALCTCDISPNPPSPQNIWRFSCRRAAVASA